MANFFDGPMSDVSFMHENLPANWSAEPAFHGVAKVEPGDSSNRRWGRHRKHGDGDSTRTRLRPGFSLPTNTSAQAVATGVGNFLLHDATSSQGRQASPLARCSRPRNAGDFGSGDAGHGNGSCIPGGISQLQRVAAARERLPPPVSSAHALREPDDGMGRRAGLPVRAQPRQPSGLDDERRDEQRPAAASAALRSRRESSPIESTLRQQALDHSMSPGYFAYSLTVPSSATRLTL